MNCQLLTSMMEFIEPTAHKSLNWNTLNIQVKENTSLNKLFKKVLNKGDISKQ